MNTPGTPQGLTSQEAARRLLEVGPNELAEKRTSWWVKLFSYFWGPVPWMIEVALVLTALIGRWEDFFNILTLLLLNAGVGFFQERKADEAVEALKRKLALRARVRRNGKWEEIPARELVPGDLVRVRPGEIVPADLELGGAGLLQIDESSLTGESLPVEKREGDSAYSGSIVRQGEMNGTVASTGMDTFFGKTTRLVEMAESESHFQKAVVKTGDHLIVLAFTLVVLIFLVAIYRHESLLQTLQFALVLTVAAIPAALPAVLSATMVVGAMALARKKAIVSRLVAIEEMAGVDVLCSDKTGTITRNELTVAEVWPLGSVTEEDVLLFGLLASREENADPIDNAVITAARERAGNRERESRYRVDDFTPFDPVAKRTEARGTGEGGAPLRVIKGAPQVVLEAAADGEAIRDVVNREVDSLAARGYRALGVARAEGDAGFTFLGLLALFDPPREDSAETVRRTQELGVQVKMVTGDRAAIARQVSEQVHLGTRIEEVSAFLGKPDREAERVVEEADGFAQVFPEHKYHIVDLLQRGDHLVGMTGDGVNDAPALKKMVNADSFELRDAAHVAISLLEDAKLKRLLASVYRILRDGGSPEVVIGSAGEALARMNEGG